MSRKSIVFKTPPAPPSEAPAPPAAAREPHTPDLWVERRALAAREAPAPELANPFAIDLSAERNLSQIMALSMAMPSMLGWFWLNNAFERCQRALAK